MSSSGLGNKLQTSREITRQNDHFSGSEFVPADAFHKLPDISEQAINREYFNHVFNISQGDHQNMIGASGHAAFNLKKPPAPLPQHIASPLLNGLASDPHRATAILPKRQLEAKHIQRTESMPASMTQDGVSFISGRLCANLLKTSLESTLFIDVRPYPQYLKSRIRGALNLCVPTTLLKRSTFSLKKLEETLSGNDDKKTFAKWKRSARIIAYDTSCTHLKDSLSLISILKKFKNEGFQGDTFILHGGFSRFATDFPDCTEKEAVNDSHKSTAASNRLSLSLPKPTVIGGCPMPTKLNCPVNPFFSHIRQNIELSNGVGQIPISIPDSMSGHERQQLPVWLRDIITDNGKLASERFFEIEKAEQNRMREAYTGKLPSSPAKPNSAIAGFRIAGIEKGTKNRYKDIYPFDHTRVRLKQDSHDGCDYVNASFIKASRSNRQYIATQAPIPSTFTVSISLRNVIIACATRLTIVQDFWRLIWEQDVRAIVMLTAELEGFHVKCHPYWKDGHYGQLKIEQIGQTLIPLESNLNGDPTYVAEPKSTNDAADGFPGLSTSDKKDPLVAVVRRLRLTTMEHSDCSIREVVQIQFSGWPDFGKPTKPAHLLKLMEICNDIFEETNADGPVAANSEPVPPCQRKIVVHCSAGCGRTGTFCTIDSVIDMLKHQRVGRQKPDQWTESSQWIYRDDIDLVAETVEEFRHQRLSMVQTLQQFVLCYESILEWISCHEMRR